MKCRATFFSILFFLLITINTLFGEQAEEVEWEELFLSVHAKTVEMTKPDDASAPSIPMANLEGEPSTFIGGHVNVITGDFNDFETDLVLPGVAPLTLERSFSGSTFREAMFCLGWNLNLQGTCHGNYYKEDGKRQFCAVTRESHGSRVGYKKQIKKKEKYVQHAPLSHDNYKKGVTNTASGRISAQSNIKNTKASRLKSDIYRIQTGDNGYKEYKKTASHANCHALFRHHHPNGNFFQYSYLKKKRQDVGNPIPYFDSLKKVEMKSSDDRVLATVSFREEENFKKRPFHHVTTCDGRTVKYHFKQASEYFLKEHNLLEKVERSDGPTQIYTYILGEGPVGGLIYQKVYPDKRYIQLQYYKKGKNTLGEEKVELESKKDHRINRVASLFAPVGPDTKPVRTHEFIYQFKLDKKGHVPDKLKGGSTTVLDAMRNKSVYHYNKSDRLLRLEKFDKNNKLYSQERLFWGGDDSDLCTNLITRSLESGSGELVFSRSYHYDSSGNVLKNTLYGNLTGKNPIAPQIDWDGTHIENGCESYEKHSRYSNDGFNLLLWESDGTKENSYEYYAGSNKLKAKFIGDSETIYLREFYEYNSEAAVTKIIADDGCTKDPLNLSGVTERHITYNTPRNTYPFGLPEIEEEKYLDLSTGQEVLKHKVVNWYTARGTRAKQEHYDNTGALAYTLHWDYDEKGRLIRECDALGRTTEWGYDENGNCLFEQGPNQELRKEYTYDFSNRLIKEDHLHSDGANRTTHYRYNLLSQLIAIVDGNGNESQYSYDAFGRVIEIRCPNVINEAGELITPKVRRSYDLMGNITCLVDAMGNEKRTTYTLRGQPISVVLPDGQIETHTYNLDGSLCQTTASNGTVTSYTYDPLGRTIKTEVISAAGELLSSTSAIYSGFHILSEIDPMGKEIRYNYYGDGKLKSKESIDAVQFYSYDSLGRPATTTDRIGPEFDNVLVKSQAYDLLNRVIEERVEDRHGNVCTQINTAYDISGNITEVTIGDGSVTTSLFDSHGTPTVIIDAEGNQTTTQIFYDHVNSLGQTVAYKETVDPLGNIIAVTSDALGRIVSTQRKNTVGNITQQQQAFYDANGNRVRVVDTILSPNAPPRDVVTIWTYDSLCRITSCCEAFGTPEQKKISIRYNAFGQKDGFVKADGMLLTHTYDSLGRLASLSSSDGTVHYAYHYDLNGHPIQVDDLVNDTSSLREYDPAGRLLKETLGNGLTMEYRYDAMGRQIEVLLPENGSFAYDFEACFLKKAKRKDSKGDVLYEHHYTAYDAFGRLIESSLIGNSVTCSTTYDKIGRVKSFISNVFEESLEYDPVGNLVDTGYKDSLGLVNSAFCYDDLYQLTCEDGTAASHTYGYDSHYNRIEKDGKAHKHNALNQLLLDGNSNFSYDTNGNLRAKSSSTNTANFCYDALDRLISVTDNDQQVVYTYDESNRRLSKSIYTNTSASWQLKDTTRYLYQGQNEIGSCDAQGKIQELRLLGIGKGAEIGAAVAIEIEDKVFAPIHNQSGHLVALVDPLTGETVQSYRYTAFGEELFSEALSPWRFSSKRADPETGFVYFGRRYYDPEIGRWTSQDPINREGGPNLYAYVLNSPLTHCDLYGLITLPSAYGQSRSTISVPAILGNLLRSPGYCIERAAHHLIPIHGLKDVFGCAGWMLQGKTPSSYVPSWKQPKSQTHVHEGTRFFEPFYEHLCFNGMCTSFDEFKVMCANYSKEREGVKVHGFYNATNGFVGDLIEVGFQKLGIRTDSQVAANKGVRELHEKMGEYKHLANFFTKAHSQGCETVHNLPRDMKKIMDVKAYGPARVLVKEQFINVENFVCICDPIPIFADPAGFFLGAFSGSINFLKNHGCPIMSHFIDGQTYRKAAIECGVNFKLDHGCFE